MRSFEEAGRKEVGLWLVTAIRPFFDPAPSSALIADVTARRGPKVPFWEIDPVVMSRDRRSLADFPFPNLLEVATQPAINVWPDVTVGRFTDM